MKKIDRINVNSNICHGEATIRGTRIPVSVILDNLADGHSIEEITASYPSLSEEDVRAAISYATHLCDE